MTIIHTCANHDYGIEARVARLDDGRYSVTLRDLDAGEVLPHARIYPDLERAAAYARSLTQ